MRACGGLRPILPDLAEGVNRQGSRKFPEERKDGGMGIRGGLPHQGYLRRGQGVGLVDKVADVARLVHSVRNQRIILDADLAGLYGVPAKRLNEQYRRNLDRFPADFAFQLTPDEWSALRPQIATLTSDPNLKSQIATSSLSHGGRRKLPVAFTEHGALMAANILNSPRAVAMSVYVIRAFVKMRSAFRATVKFCIPHSTFCILLSPLRNHLSLKLASTSKKTPSLTAPTGEQRPRQNMCCECRCSAWHHFRG